jgi:hypothetical protein
MIVWDFTYLISLVIILFQIRISGCEDSHTAERYFLSLYVVARGFDAIRGWRKLHKQQLYKFYSSPSIIRMFKSRKRWAWHLA